MTHIVTDIPDVVIFEPRVFEDDRGWFMETFRSSWLEEALGLEVNFVQDNQSRSRGPVLRGLHYQLPRPQGKLVRATHGSIWDVAVDLRINSPTFKRWVGVELSADNKRQLWIPEGFGHGFVALSDEVDVLYKATDFYVAEADRTVAWDDPSLAIDWPADPTQVILSERDRSGDSLETAQLFD